MISIFGSPRAQCTGTPLSFPMSPIPDHILLADDNEAFAELLADQLTSEYGYKTHVVHDGLAAKEALAAPDAFYSLVIADYDMPMATGLELLRWMGEKGMKTPVIVLTGAGTEEVAVRAMKLGAYDYLKKEELDIQRLVTTVRATIERRRARAAEELEAERTREVALNQAATDQLRTILGGIAPMLSSALAGLEAGLDRLHEDLGSVRKKDQESTGIIVDQLRKEASKIQAGLKTLLDLYALTYSHRSHLDELETLGKQLEKQKGK
ncbi:MAG: hypothetical protein A3C56_03385 [Ignavibacteria bacterium RIFCSPHIGHO2_02_FULL_56_12]|nr:MAG: hypothetical protein A3C56_03385 [Ignavibacteria bacterium RIFCSPHIGHO2_02_FULL_56_12]